MALVSRAVAAATRTPTTAALDAATQELVKSAIREHLKDAGLIPAAHPGDPPATPVPSLPPNGPGGAQPQDQKKKEADGLSNPKAGKKGPLALGTTSIKGEGSAKRRGKLSKRNSEAGDETIQATDDAADDEF